MIGRMRTSRSAETTAPDRRSALASGILTGLSSLVLSASGAIAAAILAQKFGRDAGTDGLLAAYGVYVTLVLAAQALRLTAVPELTRTEGAVAGSLRGGDPRRRPALDRRRVALRGAVRGAADGQAAAGGGRSRRVWRSRGSSPRRSCRCSPRSRPATLAARNRFGAAALGFSAGGVAGLVVFIVLADEHGLVALAWGLAANGARSRSASRSPRSAGYARAAARSRRVARRLVLLAEAAAVPLALQVLYLIALRGASGIGVGAVTSLSYAYFFAAVLVAATATSLSIISTAELTRRGVEAEAAVEHVVHGSWLCLPPIAAAAGVFALVGGRIAEVVLGDAFSGEVGDELARLVVVLAPWTVAAVGVLAHVPAALRARAEPRARARRARGARPRRCARRSCCASSGGSRASRSRSGSPTSPCSALCSWRCRGARCSRPSSRSSGSRSSVGGLAVLSFGAFALVPSTRSPPWRARALRRAARARQSARATRGVGLHARHCTALRRSGSALFAASSTSLLRSSASTGAGRALDDGARPQRAC